MPRGRIESDEILNCAACNQTFKRVHYKSKFCSRKCYERSRWMKLIRKNYHLKSTYNMNRQNYETLVQQQKGKCAVCEKSQVQLNVDHCHQSGVVRGLLCKSCNLLIGLAHDQTSILEKAKQYLTQSKELKKIGAF